jgi:acetoacetate decarboxylase
MLPAHVTLHHLGSGATLVYFCEKGCVHAMGLKHDDGWNIPTDYPFYPSLPAIYRNVKFQYVFFHADPGAVQELLPEPLQATEDGLCVAAGIDVPFCTNYGAFQESFVVMRCRFRNQTGFFCSHVFHNGPAGIAAGREIYGTPKVYAKLKIRQAERSMLTETFLSGVPVLQIDLSMTETAQVNAMPPLTPAWRLKVIPKADGPGPALKQLIDCSETTQHLKVHFMAKGAGRVVFGPSSLCDLSSLNPLGYGDAFYMECSYSEGYAEIAYDYLAQGNSA